MSTTNTNKVKKNSIGLWEKEGKFGQYYMSKKIDAAMFDELQKAEPGAVLVLDPTSSENANAPAFTLKVLPKRSDSALTSNTTGTRAVIVLNSTDDI